MAVAETEEAFQGLAETEEDFLVLAAEPEEAIIQGLAEIDLQEVVEIMTIGFIPIQEDLEVEVLVAIPETEVAMEGMSLRVINPEVLEISKVTIVF